MNEEIIKKAIEDLMRKWGDKEDDGTRFVRIDEDEMFEGDGGVSIDTASKEITDYFNSKR